MEMIDYFADGPTRILMKKKKKQFLFVTGAKNNFFFHFNNKIYYFRVQTQFRNEIFACRINASKFTLRINNYKKYNRSV